MKSSHLPLVAKWPNYLHRKHDYYLLISKKDYSSTKLASKKSVKHSRKYWLTENSEDRNSFISFPMDKSLS